MSEEQEKMRLAGRSSTRTDEGLASRLTAAEILYRVDQEAAYADVLLGGRLPDVSPADRRLITRLVRATRETAPMPTRERNEKSFLAVAYSHPRWMVERFVDWFGVENAERLMTANNDAAPNAIRLNLARGSRAEIIEKLSADGFGIGAPGRAPETIVLNSAPHF